MLIGFAPLAGRIDNALDDCDDIEAFDVAIAAEAGAPDAIRDEIDKRLADIPVRDNRQLALHLIQQPRQRRASQLQGNGCLENALEPVARRAFAGDLSNFSQHLIVRPGDQLAGDHLLGGEVLIERTDAHAGDAGHGIGGETGWSRSLQNASCSLQNTGDCGS